MSTLQFAIAIPVYQQAHFIDTALKSIQVQHSGVNLAIMDATPDDSVQQVLANFSDLFSYRRHGPDAGQTAAIQEGWDNIPGDIVAWLCADDYYYPDTFAKVRQIFTKYPDIDVVYGNSVFIDDSGQFLGFFPALDRDITVITKKCSISQPSCFVRRRAFDKIGKLNTELHYIMDWELWTRLYLSGAKFYCLEDCLSAVRIYPGTKTASRSSARFAEIARHLWRNTTPWHTLKSFLHFYCYDLVNLKLGKVGESINHLLDTYRQHKQTAHSSSKVFHPLNQGYVEAKRPLHAPVEITLPWYSITPNMLCLYCSETTAPMVKLNDLPLTVKYQHNGEYCYDMPAIDLASHLLYLHIAPAHQQPWYLGNVLIT